MVSKTAGGAAKRNLLVFGGTGYVGRRVVKYALDQGWEVTSVSRSGQAPYGFPDAWRVQWLGCDVTNRRSVEELLTRVPTPVSAVISTVGLLTLDRTTAIQLNGTANTNILAALYRRQQQILDRKKEVEEAKQELARVAAEAAAAAAAASKPVIDNTPKTEEKKSTEKKVEVSETAFDFQTSDALATTTAANTAVAKKGSKAKQGAVAQFEDDGLPFHRYVPAPIPEENKLPLELPPLTAHESGLPRFVLISAANFGFPFTKILRAYYDGKISAERAMFEHVQDRGVILRPGAIHGIRHTASNVPIPLSAIFWPMEKIFSPLYSITGLKMLQPPVSVDAVAKAALVAAGDDHFNSDEHAMKRLRIDPGYGHAKGGISNWTDNRRTDTTSPIFDYAGIKYLAGKFH